MDRLAAVCGLIVVVLAITCRADLPHGFHHGSAFAFHGHYGGHCGNDGFYYKDHYSFIICSNGNAYEQPCAPGSRNSDLGHFSHGRHYHYRDFCDVNLVDYGYGAHRPAYGHRHARPAFVGYGHPGYAVGPYH